MTRPIMDFTPNQPLSFNILDDFRDHSTDGHSILMSCYNDIKTEWITYQICRSESEFDIQNTVDNERRNVPACTNISQYMLELFNKHDVKIQDLNVPFNWRDK